MITSELDLGLSLNDKTIFIELYFLLFRNNDNYSNFFPSSLSKNQ